MISSRLLLLLTLLAPQVPATNLTPSPPASREVGLAVEVVDGKGEPPRPGKAVEVTVSEDGAARRVVGTGAIGEERPWRMVIWVDRMLSGSRTVRGAAGALAAQAPTLVLLGTVEVIVAEPEPRIVLPPTRDARAVDEALSRLLLTGDGRDDLRTIRQHFLDSVGAPTTAEKSDLAGRAEEALRSEVRLVSHQQDALVGWLATERHEEEKGTEGPRAFFLVSDGFDRDPRELYLAQAAKTTDAAARAAIDAAIEKTLPAAALEATAAETARTAAELGWTVLPMPVGDERLPELKRWRLGSSKENPSLSVTIKPGKGAEPPPPPPAPVLLHPREPLEQMAEATGGEVLGGPSQVGAALARLRSRLWVRYEAPAVPASGSVEVRAADPKLTAKARKWDGPATPEGVSDWRARHLLTDAEGGESEEPGELSVAASVHDGNLELHLDPRARPAPGGSLRLTLAVTGGPDGATVTRRALTAEDVAEDGTSRIPLPLPKGTERLAVVVVDPVRGRWGAEAIDLGGPEEAEETAAGTETPLAGSPAVRGPARGGGVGGTGVRIVRPASGRGTGPVDVEVELRLPAQRRLERLELFWNEELVSTFYAPPFRHRILVPRDRPVGTLRAQARLDDGSVAEDALLLNGSSLGERVDVRLVELLVVVTDKAGRPVRGLGRNDFRLLQDGKDQSIASFDDAGQFPLTVGLTLDTSASMFIKLPGVVEAARSLLTGGGLAPQDSALLVGYATTPRLLVPPTRDLRTVSLGLDTLSADGGSNLFAAIEYSLQQMRGVSGRKALILYSDGIGEGERGYSDCLRAARASNVPVYLIVTNATVVHDAEEGRSIGRYADRLEKLAEATGAKTFFVLPSQDLKPVYSLILRELRSQYLVAYYPKVSALDVWRKVDVEVTKPGLRARTLSGYYARQ